MAKVITTELQHSGASAANITLDSSKNVTCENNLQLDGNVTVTGTLPADKLTGALPAISGASLTGISSPLSHRNLAINGSMRVQQYRSAALTANGTILDRFKHDKDQVGISVTRSTIAANAGGPADEGHRYAWKGTNTSTTTHDNRYFRIQHNIEAQNLACSGWKYNDTNDNIVISFWMKTSLAGSYQFSLRTGDGTNQSFIHETPSISANTWTKVTKVIPGHANITVDNDNGVGLEFNMWITVGSTFTQSDRTQNAWVAFDGDGQAKDENVNWGNSSGATFEFTGLQIEVGDAATSFEHVTYSEELARCQRYYWTYFYEIGSEKTLMLAHNWHTNQIFGHINFPCRMRSSPSAVIANGTDYWKAYKTTPNTSSFDTMSLWNANENSAILEGMSPSVTAGESVFCTGNNASAFIAFNAEL